MQWTFRMIGQFHKAKQYAAVYGLVLYSDANAAVSEVIASNRHCKALNEISGRQWLVFASREVGSTSGIAARNGESRLSKRDALYIGYHGSLSRDVLWSSDCCPPVLEQLGLLDKSELPCLMLLFPDDEETCLTYHVAIDDDSPEEAYQSMARLLRVITFAIAEISPANLYNPIGVRSAISFALEGEKQMQAVKRSVPLLKWLISKFVSIG